MKNSIESTNLSVIKLKDFNSMLDKGPLSITMHGSELFSAKRKISKNLNSSKKIQFTEFKRTRKDKLVSMIDENNGVVEIVIHRNLQTVCYITK